MICPKCGKEFPDDLNVCPTCSAESESAAADTVQSPTSSFETGTEMARRPRRGGLFTAIAVIIVLGLVIALGYALKSRQAPDIRAMLPAECAFAGGSDAAWLWDALSGVRSEPAVAEAMKSVENELGITFSEDLVPWIGQAGFAMLGFAREEPMFAVVCEIRDQAAFTRFAKQIEARVARETKSRWTEIQYSGVTIRTLNLQEIGKIKTCVVDGWAVIGYGERSAEIIIDVSQKKAASLFSNKHFKKAFEKLDITSQKPVAWASIDYEAMTRLTPEQAPMKIPEESALIQAITLCETGKELRFDTVQVPKTEKAKKMLQNWASILEPVDGRSLEQLPEGTFAAYICSKPGKIIETTKQIISNSLQPEERSQFDMATSIIQPPFEVANKINGESALGLTWRDGFGIGVVAVGETEGAAATKECSEMLKGFVGFTGMSAVTEDKTGVYTINSLNTDEKNIHIQVCWKPNDKWLEFASHPVWLDHTSTTDLTIPKEASGAETVGMGNFKFLPSLLNWIEDEVASSDMGVVDLIRRLEIEKSHWIAWSTYEADGSMSHSVFILRDWDWKNSLRMIADYVSQTVPKLRDLPQTAVEGN